MKKSLFIIILVLFIPVITGCKNQITTISNNDDDKLDTSKQYSDILKNIETYELSHSIPTSPIVETKSAFNWRFALAADAVPILIGSCLGPEGFFLGLFYGALSSALVGCAAGDWSDNSTTQNTNVPSSLSFVPQEFGVIHNIVLNNIMEEVYSTNDVVTEEWLFNKAKDAFDELFPEETIDLTYRDYKANSVLYPNVLGYSTFPEYKDACYQLMPDKKGALDVVFKVHDTVSAQPTSNMATEYVGAVSHIIEESSLPEIEKKCLVGTVMVESASNEFWHEY